ncbi:Fur family transcriptional regulator [Clostridium sp. 001]|uniref:Fur family transcriptional regulator n=1 Tax=Clostridium sp. 001 TaxID=1970093 RepID=UPI001C2C76ED|nr:Fur family transcriptional regulator [Clostridium sp. 001]QXE20637.1 hypothetical protein B5S50_18245 [Clostridium sp. 001]
MRKLEYIENAKAKLKAEGYKFTSSRAKILNAICGSKKHITADEIYKKLKEKNIGVTTVYRNVSLFEKIGILKEIYASDKRYYELEGTGKYKIHIHTKCVRCNKVMDLDDKYIKDNLNSFMKTIEKSDCVSVQGVSIILSVLCDKCKT